LLAGAVFALALLSPARGADDDIFAPAEKPEDYWRRVKFEIEVGKFDLAAKYLKDFLAALDKLKGDERDQVLRGIEAKDGMSSFLRLRQLPELVGDIEERRARLLKNPKAREAALKKVNADRRAFRTDVDKLLDRVNAAVKKELQDPKRLRKLIKNLGASREERAWAINQLRRSGAAAVPCLIEALRDTEGKFAHKKVNSAILRLDDTTVPPFLAALDIPDDNLRRDIIDLMSDRGEPRAVPELTYLSASDKVPETLRRRAARAVARIKRTKPDKLPDPRTALTQMANDYEKHRVRFPNPQRVSVWRFDPEKKQLAESTLTADQAEEYYGLRYARMALNLDPAYRPAQVVFATLALEKAYGNDIHLALARKAPAVRDLLRTVSPELVTDVLDRGLREGRLPVILGAVQVLGDLGDVRAGKLPLRGGPVLARALNYPDRRVQMAAVNALVRVPGEPSKTTALRVVQVLRRLLQADPKAKVMVAYFDQRRADQIARLVRDLGYEPVVVRTRREALGRLREAADVDAILIDYAFPHWEREFPFVLAEMRADVNYGLLPVIVTAPETRVNRLRDWVWRYRNVWVEPDSILLLRSRLKELLAARIREAMGRPLSDAERDVFAKRALDLLGQMATGELPGYDVRPAEEAVIKALHSRDVETSLAAIEILGRLPGAEAQRHLAEVVLDSTRDKLRGPAAFQLSRQIQRTGLVLSRQQIKRIGELYATTRDKVLRDNLSLVIGAMRPGRKVTGERLRDYRPMPSAEKEEEKDKGKPQEKDKPKGKKEDEKDKNEGKDKDGK
jgi:CheY-like chemotaxis protein